MTEIESKKRNGILRLLRRLNKPPNYGALGRNDDGRLEIVLFDIESRYTGIRNGYYTYRIFDKKRIIKSYGFSIYHKH